MDAELETSLNRLLTKFNQYSDNSSNRFILVLNKIDADTVKFDLKPGDRRHYGDIAAISGTIKRESDNRTIFMGQSSLLQEPTNVLKVLINFVVLIGIVLTPILLLIQWECAVGMVLILLLIGGTAWLMIAFPDAAATTILIERLMLAASQSIKVRPDD